MLQRALTCDLIAVGTRDWAAYGTHSFRRGGCQYREQMGWTIQRIGNWGGWSTSEATTMMKYLFSPKDDAGLLADYDRPENKRARRV